MVYWSAAQEEWEELREPLAVMGPMPECPVCLECLVPEDTLWSAVATARKRQGPAAGDRLRCDIGGLRVASAQVDGRRRSGWRKRRVCRDGGRPAEKRPAEAGGSGGGKRLARKLVAEAAGRPVVDLNDGLKRWPVQGRKACADGGGGRARPGGGGRRRWKGPARRRAGR
ncbi:uncharacterized protein A4U43_C04F4200 [Asparagus officinalis]|uniref:Uncharacterized protein n=1 Tax=Asparagus officinalis TaxID=4686 RepID=A0A5P1F341_ASPOF|nr:uncharacterized protein A4U43_C04F4200 [Asparagus officinalis]